MANYRRALAAIALMALLGAACGSEGDGSDATGAGAQGGGGDALSIAAPEDGAEVSLPFTLELDSADPLGAPDTGDNHVHVFYDGDDGAYEVVSTDTFEVTDLSPGEHTVTASLRNADHSAAGTDVTIDLTVVGGEEDSGSSKDSGKKDEGGSNDPNYGY